MSTSRRGFVGRLAAAFGAAALPPRITQQTIPSLPRVASDVPVDEAYWRVVRQQFVIPPDDVARSTPRLVDGAGTLCRTLQTARDRLAASN